MSRPPGRRGGGGRSPGRTGRRAEGRKSSGGKKGCVLLVAFLLAVPLFSTWLALAVTR